MGPWMGWGGYGFGIFGWILMIVLWILIVGGITLLILWLVRQAGTSGIGIGAPSGGHALEILRERYARGEITQEEYERMRNVLEGR